jgi:hypothetical protein
MAKARANKIEYTRRIFAIQGWILEGVQSALIVRQIIASDWCTSERHAERMLKDARDLWTEIPEAEINQKRKLKIGELQQLARSMQERFKGTPAGIRAIVSVQKEIIKLEGIAPATKVEVSGKDGKPIETKNYNVSLSKEEIIDISKTLDSSV